MSSLRKAEGILKTTGEQTIVLDRLSGLNSTLLAAENDRKNAAGRIQFGQGFAGKNKSLVELSIGRFITEKENEVTRFRNETAKQIAGLNATKAKLQQEFHDGVAEILEVDRQITSLEGSLTKLVEKNDKEIREFRQRSATDLLNNLETKFRQAQEKEDKIRAAFDAQYREAQGQNTGAVTLKLLEQNIDANKGFLDKLRETAELQRRVFAGV